MQGEGGLGLKKVLGVGRMWGCRKRDVCAKRVKS